MRIGELRGKVACGDSGFRAVEPTAGAVRSSTPPPARFVAMLGAVSRELLARRSLLDRQLALHRAVLAGASEAVVAAVVDAHPEGAAVRDGAYDRLPLHHAVVKGAPLGVVAALLRAYPDGAAQKDFKGQLPLHTAVAQQAPRLAE